MSPTQSKVILYSFLVSFSFRQHLIRSIAPNGYVSTVAGFSMAVGLLDQQGTSARFDTPSDVTVSPNGTVYVADRVNHAIRAISPSGYVSTVAGIKAAGTTDGQGTIARFSQPQGIAVAPNGTIYVADTSNHRIRAISPSGVVSTVAGSTTGFADGSGSSAKFASPIAVHVAPNGTVYVADYNNHRIRAISPSGLVSTIAGDGTQGLTDGPALNANFRNPVGLGMSSNGALYIADSNNHVLRALSSPGVVSTVAGGGVAGWVNEQDVDARFSSPRGIAFAQNGTLFVVDNSNHRIRSVSPSVFVSTVAGNGTWAYQDGPAFMARFNNPNSVAVHPNGTIYVSDTNSNIIRAISPNGDVRTVAEGFYYPYDMVFNPSGTILYVADQYNNRICGISSEGVVSTIAGTGDGGSADGPAMSATFNRPHGIALSPNGTLFVSENVGNVIRAISPDGMVTTFAGMAGTAGATDGVGTSARFSAPRSIALTPNGTLYVVDTSNYRIRAISPNGTVTTIAGSSNSFADGQGTAAAFGLSIGIAVSPTGVVYVSDAAYARIRVISTTGYVSTLAGTGITGALDAKASSSTFNRPAGLALSANGTLFIADSTNNRIRAIKP